MAGDELFLKLLTDETFGSEIKKQPRFSFTDNTLKTIQLENIEDKFLRLKVDGHDPLDFPINWSAFGEVSLDNTIEIRSYDSVLYNAICEYLNLSVDIVLVKSTDGFFFVCHEIKVETKKAA